MSEGREGQGPAYRDGICANCGNEARVYSPTQRCIECEPGSFESAESHQDSSGPAIGKAPADPAQGHLPDQHHPYPQTDQAGSADQEAAGGDQSPYRLHLMDTDTMTRGEKARIAAAVIEDVRLLTREDPAFDLARNYLAEARQVMPTKAE